MLQHLLVHNIELWAESYLAALAETRQRPSLISDLRALLRSSRPRPPARAVVDERKQA